MINDKDSIAECVRLIEEKLDWGSGAHWQHADFERLAQQIFEQTEVQLSVSTLKRIWGKVQYSSMPNLATLNALAQFAGFGSWRAFMGSHQIGKQNATAKAALSSEEAGQTLSPQDQIINPAQPHKKKGLLIGSIVAILLLAAASGSILMNKKPDKSLNTTALRFTSRPVTKGLPNTVVFEYDADSSNADSIQIQQSWDSRLREKVDKKNHHYTTTYYYPGYYRAKLLLNDSVVKEHDLFVETEGWAGLIEQTPVPVYLSASQSRTALDKGIIPSGLLASNISIKETPYISFYNVNSQKVVDGKNFRMEATVKNTFKKADGVCQFTEIILMCTMGVHVIPLSVQGCIGELNLVIANKKIEGKHNDLSGFGPGFDNWANVIFTVQNGTALIFINDKEVYREKLTREVGNIIGTRLRFKGSGRLDHFALNNL